MIPVFILLAIIARTSTSQPQRDSSMLITIATPKALNYFSNFRYDSVGPNYNASSEIADNSRIMS
jgi:hypothetical protein